MKGKKLFLLALAMGTGLVLAPKQTNTLAAVDSGRNITAKRSVVSDILDEDVERIVGDGADKLIISPTKFIGLNIQFRYQNEQGDYVPLRGLKYQITYTTQRQLLERIDEIDGKKLTKVTPITSSPITHTVDGYLNEQGRISIINKNASFLFVGDISVTITTETEATYVTDKTNTKYQETFTYSAGSTGNVNIRKTTDVNDQTMFGRACSIAEMSVTAQRYAKYLNNDCTLPVCSITYPADSGCNYTGNHINMVGKERYSSAYPHCYESWDVMCHEYGHHVQRTFGISQSPGGTHYVNSNVYNDWENKGYSSDYVRKNGIKLAYGEGWATSFSMFAQEWDQAFCGGFKTCADGCYTAYNGVNSNFKDYHAKYGEASEDAIATVLYNMHDGLDLENDPDDVIEMDDELFWRLSQGAYTMSDFINHCYDYGMNVDDLAELLEKTDIAPSGISHGDTYYLDRAVEFTWRAGNYARQYKNNLFSFSILNQDYIPVLTKTLRCDNVNYVTMRLNADEWEKALSLVNSDWYGVVIGGSVDKDGLTTGQYMSAIEWFEKPTERLGVEHKSITVAPKDWGFSQTYITKAAHANYNHEFVEIDDDTVIDVDRLRCGTITANNNKKYVTLSPKKSGEGKAYLELHAWRYFESIDFELAMWSSSEGIKGAKLIVEVEDCEQTWTKDQEILVDNLPIKENGFTTFTTASPTDVYGIRFVIETAATGSSNKGRICLNNITFNY